jgi:hypothetical protein
LPKREADEKFKTLPRPLFRPGFFCECQHSSNLSRDLVPLKFFFCPFGEQGPFVHGADGVEDVLAVHAVHHAPPRHALLRREHLPGTLPLN